MEVRIKGLKGSSKSLSQLVETSQEFESLQQRLRFNFQTNFRFKIFPNYDDLPSVSRISSVCNAKIDTKSLDSNFSK